MTYIELSGKLGRGIRTKVDQDVFDKYGGLKWYLGDTGYVLRKSGEVVRLHRLVTSAPEGMVVDHLNGDKLDNRRANLRICTQLENARNLKNIKGYSWDASKGRWIVRYRRKFYGRYLTEAEAQRAYQRASSGVEYVTKKRKFYHLPTGITKQFGKFRVRPQVDGTRHWLGQFATLEEAINILEQWRRERG